MKQLAALEVILLASTLSYLALAVSAFTHRNGRIWTVFRIHVCCTFLFTLGGYLGVHFRVFRPGDRGALLTTVVLALIGLPRLVDAIADMILAVHLRKPHGNGVPPPERIREPMVLHRRTNREAPE